MYFLSSVKMKNVPNILSTLRIILAPVFLYLYLQVDLFWSAISIVIFTIAAITDFFDGHIARKHEIETPLGVFLDPLADKFLTFSAFIVLPFVDEQQFPWWAIIVIIFRDIFITSLRIFARRRKMDMKTRFIAKTKTTVQMVFLYIALLVGVFAGHDVWLGHIADSILSTNSMLYLMLFVTALTAYSGLEYVVVNRGLFVKSIV